MLKISMKFMSIMLLLLGGLCAFAGEPRITIETLKTQLNRYGSPKLKGSEKIGDKSVPGLYFGSRKMNGNYDVVDNAKKTFGGTATLFVKSGDEFVRISTNVLKEDGTRAVGTSLARNKAFEAISKGETFCGDVEILGSLYDTCYEPIKDGSEVIGIYYVGFKK